MPYSVVVVHDEAGLHEHLAGWEDLARCAAEPNAFYEPWALLPALRAFASSAISFALVYHHGTGPGPLLCGFFPLENGRLHRLAPVRVVTLWKHLYCFLCTPLVRAGHDTAAIDALLDWLRRDPAGAPLWRLELISADGPFVAALTEACRDRLRPTFLRDACTRPILEAGDPATLSSRRLKDLRRKERALGARGRLERRRLEPDGDVAAWTQLFLDLEASGWKGRQQTAMSCTPRDATFFREMAAGAFARGQLDFLGLFLDGRPVALKCNFHAARRENNPHPGSFAFKIAFDETHAASSPGLLLELDNIDDLARRRPTRWLDSCVVPGPSLFHHIWGRRRVVHDLLLATGRAPGDLLVALWPLARWLKRLLRRPRRSHLPDGESPDDG